MKLLEALKLIQHNPGLESENLDVFLACGFAPLHLQTFLCAHLRQFLPECRISVHIGLFGDCLGNVERALRSRFDAVAGVLEWDDLDPRLGLRQLGGWGPGVHADVLANVANRLDRLSESIVAVVARSPVALCLPTLSLPPISLHPRRQGGSFELELLDLVSRFSVRIVKTREVRVASSQRLAEESPAHERRDIKSELTTGFPYRLAHASSVAGLLARLLFPPAPKKGLISDLDDTLWRGILGDVGVRGISWDLDRHTSIHGLYQQLLGSLAEAGVLIAAASKNDRELVQTALEREDLVVPGQYLFPVEAHWGSKAESVERILQAWNIAAESVVFVDDSPLELAEVKAAFPKMECLRFPTTDHEKAFALLGVLRDLFGKETIVAEDAVRRESLRRSAWQRTLGSGVTTSSDQLLREVEAELTLDYTKDPDDPRALELVNKTNQFNLNGRRSTEACWWEFLRRDETFLLRASYKDKFGPLGMIAVLAGRRFPAGGTLEVDTFVMSCRAFSRRIEHRCLEQLFREFGVGEIAFDYQPTARNAPLRDFFSGLLDVPPQPGFRLGRECFVAHCPPLFDQTKRARHG
jgi:FkbH-like protein